MLNIKKMPFKKNLKLQPRIFKKSIYQQGVCVNETISHHALLSIIQNSENILYTEDHPQHETFKSVHDQLNKYAELYDTGNECYKVKINMPKHGWGRQNPDKHLGLSVFHRPHRHSLAQDIYDDYDMVNAEPEIFNKVLSLNDATNHSLKHYCENRDIILKEIGVHYKLSRDDCKKTIIAFMNGMELATFVKKYNLIGCEHHSFILQFSQDIKISIDLIYTHNKHIGEDCFKADPKKFKGLCEKELAIQLKKTVASLFYTTIERYIQEIAISYLVKYKNISLYDDVVPSQDGFMLKKEFSYPDLIQDIENAVLNTVGFVIPFKQKPFDEAFPFELILDFKIPELTAEYIDNSIKSNDELDELERLSLKNTDYDLAEAVANILAGNYVCACITNNIWFQFKEHRWVRLECAFSLHLFIPNEFRNHINELIEKVKTILKTLNYETDEVKYKKASSTLQQFTAISSKLGKTNDIKNIMNELKFILFIDGFISTLDPPYLLCCSNGVIDFKTKTFRNGTKDDRCSKSTNINFITDDDKINAKDLEDLMTFIQQIIPYPELREYLLEHLASSLIGDCRNEAMYHYIGVGSNGKTKLIDLMMLVLGEYFGTMPISLICDKRAKLGSVSPEIADLKGKRFVAMQEPSKGDVINEGVMKQLTGGDFLTGRGLYQPTITFKPQFILISCTNYFLSSKSNDEGTWRRNQVITFPSRFLDTKSADYDKDNELHFPINKDVKDMFKRVKEVFLRVLVMKAFATNGNIQECAMVKNDSLNYRLSQDRVGQFIEENIIPTPNERTLKSAVAQCANIWFEENYKYKIQNRELNERLGTMYPCSKSGEYIGFTLKMYVDSKIVELSNEEIFTNAFGRNFEITGDKTDYMPSINIMEWARNNNLKINTSQSINPLLVPFGLDVKNNAQYKKKKIEGKSVWCWFGVKQRVIPLENEVIATFAEKYEEYDEIVVYE